MEQAPIVTVQEGKLRGKIVTDYRGGKYFSFQGIPYAKPPVGELRFKAPQPPESWSEIRDATLEGNPCFQRQSSKKCIGTEDCLFLNVYTSQVIQNMLAGKELVRKPVMVWIHGGAFIAGSGNSELYGPDFLITEGVVIVTINYRLGLFGFLNLEDPSLGVPGNAGLKDQVLALKWVQKNIYNFFGNPSNVTIFGQSSGAASVHYLMMSPLAKGLFHKAIIESATAFESWAKGRRSAPLIAKVLGLDSIDEKRILNILRDMPMENINAIQEKIPYGYEPCYLAPFGPVVENNYGESPFLTEDTVDLLKSGRFTKVPLMIGYNSREGLFSDILLKSKFGKELVHNDVETLLPFILKFQKGSNVSKEIAQKIKNFYYKHDSVENKDRYYIKLTVKYYVHAIKHQTRTSSSPIYLYRMSLDSTLNLTKKFGKISHPGACHGDELGYLFKTVSTPKIRPGSVEDDHIRKFIKLWTTFAKNGDPNPTGKDSVLNVTWKPVQKGQLHYLDIGKHFTVGVNPESERMAFWEEIFNLSSTVSKL